MQALFWKKSKKFLLRAVNNAEKGRNRSFSPKKAVI
jgi:hypothetical protein